LTELPRLEKPAGAALTFWQHATAAIKTHGADGVNFIAGYDTQRAGS
jgi:hypothetical protein